MMRVRRAAARLRALFANDRAEADLDREITAHLAFLEDEFRRKGLSAADARFAARRTYGGVEQAKQQHRDERTYLWIARAAQDIRYATRKLLRSPGFTIAALLTLALGIGANTAVFSVVNAVLLKPLGYPEPDRIVRFILTFPQGTSRGVSVPDLRMFEERASNVEEISAYDFVPAGIALTGSRPEEVRGMHATANYFRLFSARMQLGHSFTAEEDAPHGGKAVVLSYGLWKRRFGGDTAITGKSISIENEQYTVVGVTGKDFQSDPATDLWVPFQFDLNSTDEAHFFTAAGRLKAGVTLAQANAQLKQVATEAHRSGSESDPTLGYEAMLLRDAIVDHARSSLLMISGAVSLVLLIACANFANLLLVRATARTREIAVRAAIGASRSRIVWQLITESLLLSLAGGALGTALGLVGVRALLSMSPGDIPRIGEDAVAVNLDWRVLLFAFAASLLTGIVFGLIPAWSVSRPDLAVALKGSGGRQGESTHHTRARTLLVTGEISLSVVLLIGAALLIRTFVALHAVNTGMDLHNVLVMEMSVHGSSYEKTAQVAKLIGDARSRLNAIPGVESSAGTCCPPYASRMGLPFSMVGAVKGTASSSGDGEWMAVSPGYFDVFRIPIVRGRIFTDADNAGAPKVVVINEAMAKKYWQGKDPVGQRILIGQGVGPNFVDVPREIVGIAADTRDEGLDEEPQATMIIPEAQEPDGITAMWSQFGPMYWLVRTRTAPQSVMALVAEQLRLASAGLPVGRTRTMQEAIAQSIARQDFNMLLLTVFAASALLLSGVGIYGVMAYSVALRTREIGIRMALGAERSTIRTLVLRQGMGTALAGVAIGLGAAFMLVRLMVSFIFGVQAHDALTFIVVPVVLASVALIAVWLPARRAAQLEPIEALRAE